MDDSMRDPRQNSILEAAWQCFAAYGFRKTSMDDIARSAGMSRPALYQHYRNKEDIFRHLAQMHYDSAATNLAAALAKPGRARDVLADAFRAQGGAIMEAVLNSPHGMELLDSGKASASDIAEAGEARFCTIYAEWLTRMRGAGKIGFDGDPLELATTMTLALKGLKSTAQSYPAYLAGIGHLAALFGAGFEAGCRPEPR